MEKRKLAAIPRTEAAIDIKGVVGKLAGMNYLVTAALIEDSKILLLYFYEISTLEEGKTEAVFRTFLSSDDYITQDLTTSKVKWKTASFYMMKEFSYCAGSWYCKIFIHSKEETELICNFFADDKSVHESYNSWSRIDKFQKEVMTRRLVAKHNKELNAIDKVMSPINPHIPEFKEWVFRQAMSFSRYLIYHEVKKGEAVCECTHCKQVGFVDRKEIWLRNNEKGVCPFCGSIVLIKARGKLARYTSDERWVAYIDSTETGFVFRYFHANRRMHKNPESSNEIIVQEGFYELRRVSYDFISEKQFQSKSYQWANYKNSGKIRWCRDKGNTACMECILYPGNLPEAWEHTHMKYSALEILSSNAPTVSCRYECGIKEYIKYPYLEWFCKMGFNQLANSIMNKEYYYGSTGKLYLEGKTIYEILGLNKENTRVLQAIDGDTSCLRLLLEAQDIGLHFKPEQLKEYYETFGCNTELLKQANRKVSLHKLVNYIAKECERIPLGDYGGCWKFSYMRDTKREESHIERKRNMAKDWLEYLDWCEALNCDLNNMFIYMPNNFKAVHDRTALEYQALQNKKAAAEKRRQEALAKKRMKQLQKSLEVLFKKNENKDDFSIKGNGLVLVVPKSGYEIKVEGETLHHCVGGYVERVAKGETNILFVRKENDPESPYFTLEFNNNKIIQCRGYGNCAMPPEVNAFVMVFEKKMQDAVKNQKIIKGKKVG